MNEVLACKKCNLHALELFKVGGKMVCRPCRKDYNKNGKFTREKVKHDYGAARTYINEQKRLFEQKEREGIRGKW